MSKAAIIKNQMIQTILSYYSEEVNGKWCLYSASMYKRREKINYFLYICAFIDRDAPSLLCAVVRNDDWLLYIH